MKNIILILLVLMVGLVGIASAGTVSKTNIDVTATLTTPDTVEPETPFSVDYSGSLIDGESFSVYAWFFYEGGTCDDSSINSCTGAFLAGDGFNWGSTFSGSYEAIKPESGTVTYWFCMGDRRFGHGWNDACVSSTIVIEPLSEEPCDPEGVNHGEYLSCMANYRNENVDPKDRAGGEPIRSAARNK